MLSAHDFFWLNNILHMGLLSLTPTPSSVCTTAVNTPSPSPSITAKVPSKYHEYLSLFVEKEVTELPPHHTHDIKIELEQGKSPPFGPIYALTDKEKEVLRTYLSDNLAKGFIHPSSSLAASPILFVKKANGSLQLCVDYRGLNAITRRNQYPLPLVNDLLEAI